MTYKFTTPCFIRKNTKELRKKLEELGYSDETTIGKSHKGTCLSLKWDCYWNFGEADMVVTDGSFGIDCGTNEDLFLALAALREDSDYMQWFIDESDPYKTWYLCGLHNKNECMQDVKSCRKATEEEIIEHFNK